MRQQTDCTFPANRSSVLPAAVWLLLVLASLGMVAGALQAAESASVEAQAWQDTVAGKTRLAVRLVVPEGYYLYHTEMGSPKAIGLPLRFQVADGTSMDAYASSAPHLKEQMLYDGSGKKVAVNIHTGAAWFYFKLPAVSGAVTLEIKGQMCSDAQCLTVDLQAKAEQGDTPQAKEAFAAFPPDRLFAPPLPNWSKPKSVVTESLRKDGIAPAGAGVRAGVRGATILPDFTAPVTEARPQTASVKSAPQQAESAGNATLPDFEIRSAGVSRPILLWLGMAVLAGVLLNFMPCVLPVISLKILGFVNQSGESRRRLLGLSLAFSAGMILVFLALALLAISLHMHWGEQFQSEAFNITLAVLVFAFALSFFGVYEFGVPDAANRLQAGTLPREGYVGAFCTGMLATVLATPCSGPFLGATLSWALAQPPAVVLLVFFCLGLGMALPYVLLTMSTHLRKLLPKPGAWMLTFRQAMGFLLLLTVVYLMIFIRAANLVPTCGLLVAAAFACWLIGRYAGFTRPVLTRWLVRLAAAAVIAGTALLLFGPLQPLLSGVRAEDPEGISWVAFDEAAFADDLNNGRNVLLDFTADWCPNCKYNEFLVLNVPEVRHKLREKGTVCYQVDLTDDNELTTRYRRLLTKLGGAAIPYLVIFPGDQPKRPYVMPDVLTVGGVLQVLNRLPDINKAAP